MATARPILRCYPAKMLARTASSIRKQTRVHDQLPLAVTHARVDLAGAAAPVAVAALAIAPERVDVDDRETAVCLFRDDDVANLAAVVDEAVRGEELLPAPRPAVPVEAPHDEDPRRRIVV